MQLPQISELEEKFKQRKESSRPEGTITTNEETSYPLRRNSVSVGQVGTNQPPKINEELEGKLNQKSGGQLAIDDTTMQRQMKDLSSANKNSNTLQPGEGNQRRRSTSASALLPQPVSPRSGSATAPISGIEQVYVEATSLSLRAESAYIQPPQLHNYEYATSISAPPSDNYKETLVGETGSDNSDDSDDSDDEDHSYKPYSKEAKSATFARPSLSNSKEKAPHSTESHGTTSRAYHIKVLINRDCDY